MIDPFADVAPADAFHRAIALVWAGERPLAEVAAEARRRGLDEPLAPGRPGPPAPWVPTDEDLARIAADHDPTVGASGPDRVLGPWADEAAPRARLAAVAIAAALPPDDAPDAPLEREIRRRSGREREALRAVLRAPLAPFRIVDGHLEPLLPIGVPPGPVRLRPLARPAGDAVAAVFLRAVEGPAGWEGVAPVAVPRVPPALGAWVRLLLWEERLARPCATLDQLLARRGHALLRRALEDAW